MVGELRFRLHLPRAARACWPLFAGLVVSCSPGGIVGQGELPPDVPDPASIQTPDGATAAYRGALVTFQDAFGGHGSTTGDAYVLSSGLLTDELTLLGVPLGTYAGLGRTRTDSRQLPEVSDPAQELVEGGSIITTYTGLQKVRGQALEALGRLRAYAPSAPLALAGHLDAVRGYTELFLAELYCSGIPLSTVDFGGDYTLAPGSTTDEVYAHALTLFDSALTLATDSARILNFARVGKGRALLDLGRYAEAAAVVGPVPEGFRYEAHYSAGTGQRPSFIRDFQQDVVALGLDVSVTMGDGEGLHGLDYISSGDPRTAATFYGQNRYGYSQYLPSKFAANGDGVITVADWVEARLIEAEAALQAGDPDRWLTILNHLRQTAISPALPDLADPGTADGRVDLLFRERAFWLYLTGHRQGDLRRLVRYYGRDPNSVYPTGTYKGGIGTYGSDITAPPSARERAYNPKYTGCIGRGA